MRRKYEPEILDSLEHLRRKQQRVKRPEVVQYSSEPKVQVAYNNDVGVLFMSYTAILFWQVVCQFSIVNCSENILLKFLNRGKLNSILDVYCIYLIKNVCK